MTTQRKFRPHTALAVLLGLAVTSMAAAADRIPATFELDEPRKSFQNLLKFPDVSGNFSIMMLCASQVESSGKMTKTGCYARNNSEAIFAAAVQEAAKKARMAPASINGKKHKIYLQFRVEFIKEGDAKRIEIYYNPGDAENVDAYGKDHIAAQRVIGKEPWQAICPARAQYVLVARAHVDGEGVAGSVSLRHGDGIVPTGACQQAIIEVIESSLYVPAMADGVPVPSAFVEPFGN